MMRFEVQDSIDAAIQAAKQAIDDLTRLEIVAAVKGDDRYVLIFDGCHRHEALSTIGRWAADPALNLEWSDAARMAARVRSGMSTKVP